MSTAQSHKQVTSKHLFIDDHFIEEMSGVNRRFHQPVKCEDNPVIRADQPWEKDAAFMDSAIAIYDEAEGQFRAWYQGGACYGPADGSNMCYATSQDGIHWDKPSLGLVEFEGSKDNNIVLMASCMMHDPAPIIDRIDPDPGRRYKAIWWGGREDASEKDGWLLGHCVGFSPDGIHWQEHPENPIWPGDPEVAIPAGLERTSGPFVAYSSADGYGMRVTARAESDDFVRWQLPPQLLLESDDDDPPGTEVAGMATVDYEGTHLGMLWIAHNLPDFTRQEWQDIVARNKQQGFFGPPIELNNVRCRVLYTELAVSADGVTWQRVNRQPLFPLGPEGSWDETIGLAAKPFVHGDKIYIYYTGYGRTSPTPGATKPEKIGQWNIETGLATLRRDGFASLQADASPGVVVTKPFAFEGNGLLVNTDVSQGSLRVEVLDVQGQPIDGFTKDDAHPISGDQLQARVAWESGKDVAELRGRVVRLKFYVENGDLYSLAVVGEG